MDIIGVAIVIVSIMPFFIVNLKYKYEEATKKYKYCMVLLIFTIDFALTRINLFYSFYSLCIIVSSFSFLYSVPLYLKNKDNINALKNIIKINFAFFGVILFYVIIIYFIFYEKLFA